MKLHQKIRLVKHLEANLILDRVNVFIANDGKVTFATTIETSKGPQTIFAEVMYIDQIAGL